jgi:hypothetical protein
MSPKNGSQLLFSRSASASVRAVCWNYCRVLAFPRLGFWRSNFGCSGRADGSRWLHSVPRISPELERASIFHRLRIRYWCRRIDSSILQVPVEYLTYTYENTAHGLWQKDQYTRHLANNGYKIMSEQIEQGHIKGSEQCCLALICLPAIFLAGRTPAQIIVTYGRDILFTCAACRAPLFQGAKFCTRCGSGVVR